jgi:two-component system response regulator FlrC
MKQVLVVDDEQQMLVAIEETLRRKGFRITTASSGFEALNKLQKNFYQAVVTDVRMPELDGLTLLQKVKKLTPATPVILLTGHGSIQDAISALKQGAYDYLMKPFSANQLTEVVNKATSLVSEESLGDKVQIITNDPEMQRLLEMAKQAAQGDATVMIQAESGTGKELVARFIHGSSRRRQKPFVALNCAAVPDELLESELFGHEKGSFTGAHAQKLGKFEQAHGGTILLDEIGEMPPRLQAKLLRVLQENEIDRVGGTEPVPVDVRVIATTNRNLRQEVMQGRFREDLYYRINVIPLTIPPLRQRRGDIPFLVNFFCQKHNPGEEKKRFSDDTIDLLQKYHWPGNVRELENVTQRALALARNPVIGPSDLFLELDGAAQPGCELRAGMSIKELEKEIIRVTLDETDGNRTQASAMLGISLRTLRNKLKEYRTEGDYF